MMPKFFQISDVVNYFKDRWLGRPQRNRSRQQPKFPTVLWNCAESVHNCVPRTTNAVEAWHLGFQSALNVCHPNPYKCLTALHRQHTLAMAKYEQHVTGEPPMKRSKYLDTASWLMTVVQDYYQYIVLQTIQGR